jgi:hypothetical protein
MAQDSRQLFLSPRARREFLHSLQQVVNTATVDATTRLAIAQLAARLGKAFGLVPTRCTFFTNCPLSKLVYLIKAI